MVYTTWYRNMRILHAFLRPNTMVIQDMIFFRILLLMWFLGLPIQQKVKAQRLFATKCAGGQEQALVLYIRRGSVRTPGQRPKADVLNCG